LFLSSTEKAFVGNADKAKLMARVNDEAAVLKEIGGGGGEAFSYEPEDHSLFYYSRLSGEEHLVKYLYEKGSLAEVQTADEYDEGHDPTDGKNKEDTYYLDGKQVTELQSEVLWEQYDDAEAVTYSTDGKGSPVAGDDDSDDGDDDDADDDDEKTVDAVGASVGSAGTGTPTGDYVDVNNDEGGFAFETDKAFKRENQKAHSYVFIEDGKKVPHFDVEPVEIGDDVDRYFDTLINNLKNDQGVDIIVDPIRTRMNIKGTTIKGIEYVIESGDSEMVCMFYIYPAGSTFYKFAGFYIKDDMTTPYALQHAMETFRTA
jgi:hypothetical protein